MSKPPSRAPVDIGAVIDGRYLIDSVLGAGGMGIVFRAQHLELRQTVAVKMPFGETADNPEVVQRLLREARAAVRLRSEHVCRVLDVGRAAGGVPYVVFEYLDGTSLSDYLRRKGELPFDQIWRFLLEACDAVGEAHRLGIVHRDLKPLNLFLVGGQNGRMKLKVLDFGISKTVNPETSDYPLTESSTVLGTPSYIAPEQMSDMRSVDARADVWALGVSAYELVTGRVPFKGASLMDLAVRIAGEPAVPPSSLRADVPPALEEIILRCLEKDRANRYASANELGAALVAAAPPNIAQWFLRVEGDGGGAPSQGMRAAPALALAGETLAQEEETLGPTSATRISVPLGEPLLAATVQDRPPVVLSADAAGLAEAGSSGSVLRRRRAWLLAPLAAAIVVGSVLAAALLRSSAVETQHAHGPPLTEPPAAGQDEPTSSRSAPGSAPSPGPPAADAPQASVANAAATTRAAPSARSLAARPAKAPGPAAGPSTKRVVDDGAIPRSR